MKKNRNKTADHGRRCNIIVEPLEPRTLFSADVFSASLALDLTPDHSLEQQNRLATIAQSGLSVVDDKAHAHSIEHREVLHQIGDLVNTNEAGSRDSSPQIPDEQLSIDITNYQLDNGPPHQLIFIDARVDDSEILLQDLINNSQSDTDFNIIYLDDGSDGIDAITSALSEQSDQTYDAVHIITCLLYTSPSPRD